MIRFRKSMKYIGHHSKLELEQTLYTSQYEVVQIRMESRAYNVIVPSVMMNSLGRSGMAEFEAGRKVGVSRQMKDIAMGKPFNPREREIRSARYSIAAIETKAPLDVLECY